MSTKASKAYRIMYCSFFNKTCISFSSVGWILNNIVNLLGNNMLGDIADTSQRRLMNTERVTSVNVDPVSFTFGLGASE